MKYYDTFYDYGSGGGIMDVSLEEVWKVAKWGKFSASNMHHLLSKGVGDNLFGKGALTYIKKTARQAYTLFNTEDNVETYSMRKGKRLEPQSFAHIYKLVGVEQMTYYGDRNPIFLQHPGEFLGEAGFSPDALVHDNDAAISFGVELKCPDGDTHWDYLDTIKDQWDLKNVCMDYYTQCQFALECSTGSHWIFCSYNEFFPLKDRALLIEVTKDEPFMETLLNRLRAAITLKHEIIQKRKDA